MTEQERKVAQAQREEEYLRARRRAVGNMQFVGHLYKAAMTTEKHVHTCLQDLLGHPTSEAVEYACKLFATAGPYLQVCSCSLALCHRAAASSQHHRHEPSWGRFWIARTLLCFCNRSNNKAVKE
jgi:hypothetical protein